MIENLEKIKQYIIGKKIKGENHLEINIILELIDNENLKIQIKKDEIKYNGLIELLSKTNFDRDLKNSDEDNIFEKVDIFIKKLINIGIIILKKDFEKAFENEIKKNTYNREILEKVLEKFTTTIFIIEKTSIENKKNFCKIVNETFEKEDTIIEINRKKVEINKKDED